MVRMIGFYGSAPWTGTAVIELFTLRGMELQCNQHLFLSDKWAFGPLGLFCGLFGFEKWHGTRKTFKMYEIYISHK